MKISLVLAIIIVLFIGYQCIKVKSADCPYGSEWSDTDKHKIKLPPIEKRKLVSAIRHRSALTDEKGEERSIPKVIMQTNEKTEVPEKMLESTNSILDKNPGYEYIYFTDAEAKRFLLENFDRRTVNAYEKILPGAYKADLFRYCWLWINGGVYIDMGMVSIGDLDLIIKPSDTFVAPEDNGANAIYNAFMACSPKHPIVGEAISLAVQNIENQDYTHNPLGITGPLLLGKAFENVTGDKVFPGKEYGGGVRIIKFNKYNKCESGIIADGDVNILATRYPSYRIDQMWYNTKPHYSDMWKNKQVFGTR